ncbi:MAG: DNA-3-methyladenine glycosylase I [Thioalkalispiraceae bacterium]|jgi:DNA-3-methyladenine glycosylase I
MKQSDNKKRCNWCGDDPLYVKYHDSEWGVPVYSERKLFEKSILEGAQAGLSWITVLRKRAHYRKVFDRFDPVKLAAYDKRKVNALLKDPGIIRNRLKIEAAIKNARAYLAFREQHGKFSSFLWDFVGGEPIIHKYRSMQQLPTSTPQSDAMARALKQHGFTFVGSTICYAMMQSVGMVNDHLVSCFRYHEVMK